MKQTKHIAIAFAATLLLTTASISHASSYQWVNGVWTEVSNGSDSDNNNSSNDSDSNNENHSSNDSGSSNENHSSNDSDSGKDDHDSNDNHSDNNNKIATSFSLAVSDQSVSCWSNSSKKAL